MRMFRSTFGLLAAAALLVTAMAPTASAATVLEPPATVTDVDLVGQSRDITAPHELGLVMVLSSKDTIIVPDLGLFDPEKVCHPVETAAMTIADIAPFAPSEVGAGPTENVLRI